jgi:photosystem II stability/assembly factor-like uncharacterized protein
MQAQTNRGRAATLPLALTLLTIIFTPQSQAQWDIQDSHTTASLRGIASVDTTIAWASGTGGTVLRTTDGGHLWQRCTTPPGAENLDFRGIQAFDANTAIVMSSGKGDLSRLYKTTDACQTWKLLATNPDKEGFWDTFIMNDRDNGELLGDPVDGKFVVSRSNDEGAIWGRNDVSRTSSIEAQGRGAFAASNSTLTFGPQGNTVDKCSYSWIWFGTSGPGGSMIYRLQRDMPQCSDWGYDNWKGTPVPIAGGNASSGVFSLAFRDNFNGVAVGGDYGRPDEATDTAVLSADAGHTWQAAQTPPHGYRSAVAYDAQQKLWITVGPNGTDISRDDGRNWTPLLPSAKDPQDPPDADKNWNALSLPYVVGPKGRIGKLRPIHPPAEKQPQK